MFPTDDGRPTTSGGRPQTANRPRTARPPTEDGGLNEWAEEDYEDEEDDDVGMFTFARPTTGDPSQAANSPPNTAPFTQASAPHSQPYSPFSPFAFGFAQYGSVPPSTAAPSVGAPGTALTQPPAGSPISPAAAYAQQVQSHSAAPASPEPHVGPRKRGSWQSPDSPDHVVGNPYEDQLRREPSRRTSGSSGDKIEALASGWADQHLSYGLDANGQAIMLDEMGEPLRLATTREQKMVDAARLEQDDLTTDDFEELEDSPYAEVQASVSNLDDPEMPVLTFRTWFIGLLFCIVISAFNCFFYLRYPAPLITPIITQVLSYPIGKLLSRILPYRTWRLPRWTRRLGLPESFSLNPSPFNIKEHAAIVIMANISTTPAFGLNYTVVAEKFYHQHQPVGLDILLVLTTQMVGYGAAGLCRRFLVWPASMIWPQNLVFATLLNTLHAEADDDETGPSRFRFFLYVFAGAFAWFWLPGFLFVALSAFSWVCWIAPNNAVVNQLFGVSSGLGMGLFTFDWSQIAFLGSPLVIPWWAEVNTFVAFAIAYWVISPIMYYKNVWNTAYLPMSTNMVFDRFGAPYNTSAVVDRVGMKLNETAYQEYSPLYLPITYATAYGISFMLATSIIVHTALYHGKEIFQRVRRVRVEKEDVHMRLMKNYREVPDWWYLAFLVVAIALSIVTVACWDTYMPVWSVVVAILIGLVYLVPAGFIFALTTYPVSINLIVELVAGYIIPGLPLANILFKLYAVQVLNLGLYFVQDLKLGHYMKIPPRATFSVQVIATFVTAFVQVGIKRWLVAVVPDLCASNQSAHLICPYARTFFSASIVWGLIGPARQFDIGDYYNPILFWMLAGAILPVLTWLLARRFSNSWVRLISVPAALAGATLMPPATGINYSSSVLVCFIFQFVIRHRFFKWWSKYNFILSAGLDAGTVVCGIVIFLCLQLPKGGTISLNWWGNSVYTNTLDWQGVSYKMAPPEGFGRTSW
ncbi:Glutathione transporter 1 [Rhodotorula toruloides]|nr:Glutathione transporter 1 [Rhodotorula toruloides]